MFLRPHFLRMVITSSKKDIFGLSHDNIAFFGQIFLNFNFYEFFEIKNTLINPMFFKIAHNSLIKGVCAVPLPSVWLLFHVIPFTFNEPFSTSSSFPLPPSASLLLQKNTFSIAQSIFFA